MAEFLFVNAMFAGILGRSKEELDQSTWQSAVHPDDLLHPVVRIIYHTGRRQYCAPVEIDLARKFGNHYGQIVRAENYERWGISPQRWQPA